MCIHCKYFARYLNKIKLNIFLASYVPPTFISEVRDTRAMEGEPAKFHVHFKGNPRPDVLWYHDGKAITVNENIRILTSEDRSVLQIKSCDIDDFGFYVCKLITQKDSIESRGKLSMSLTATVSTDETVDETIKVPAAAATKEDSPKKDRAKTKIRMRKVKPGEEATGFKKQIETKSAKSFTTTKREELSTGTLEQITKINIKTTEDITIEEMDADDQITSSKSLKLADTEKLKSSEDVNNILNAFKTQEFEPFEKPLRELATVAFLIRNGITVTEITQLYHAKHFPTLQTTEVQAALVQLLEREGYAAYVSEVLAAEEAETDEAFVASTVGFRAFMRMIETEQVAVEEIISQFVPEDFVSQEWKREQTQEVG